MSDAEIRATERAAAQGDPRAKAALAAARVRAGLAQPGLVVTAHHLSPTDYGVDGGVDVDLDVEIDGVECETLPSVLMVEDGTNGGWTSYGDSADTWVDGQLLAWLRERGTREQVRAWLDVIRGVAARYCSAEIQ